MPILGYPVVSGPVQGPTAFADSRTLAFESLNGSTVMPFGGREFFLLEGCEGLDVPPREFVFEAVPGEDGERLEEIRTGKRELFLPMFLGSDSSHRQFLLNRAGLRKLFDYRTIDYRAFGGTLNLVATSIIGERRLRVVYTGGMENSYGSEDDGAEWAGLGLKFMAGRPYWFGEQWSTPIITRPAAARFFGRFPPRLASTRVLGSDVPVNVGGDVESWISVDLVGPASAVTISATGLSVTIPAGLASGETARIVTDPQGRTALFNGVKDWSRIGPTDTYQPLPPGATSLNLVIAGASATTTARVFGDSRYETPW